MIPIKKPLINKIWKQLIRTVIYFIIYIRNYFILINHINQIVSPLLTLDYLCTFHMRIRVHNYITKGIVSPGYRIRTNNKRALDFFRWLMIKFVSFLCLYLFLILLFLGFISFLFSFLNHLHLLNCG